jgi:hypothetical protein
LSVGSGTGQVEIASGIVQANVVEIFDDGDAPGYLLAALNASGSIKATDTSGGALGTLANQQTIAGYLDTEVAAILAAVDTEVASILALLQADVYVDTNVTPWDLVFMVAGSGGIGVGTELMRKNLKDVNGTNLTSTATIVGQAYQ